MKIIILILLSLLCNFTEPTEPQVFGRLHNVNYTINADSKALEWEISSKLRHFQNLIVDKWLDGPIPPGMRHITINVRFTPYNRAYCTNTDHPIIVIETNRKHLDETLMHELTHALLMIRYPDLPRWTHEGVATTWDGPRQQSRYTDILAWSRRSGTYPKLHEIMKGVRFNRHNSAAYTASNSLVKFLLSKNDRYTLFLYASGKCTLDRAYGYSSVSALQVAWVTWLNAPCIAQKP